MTTFQLQAVKEKVRHILTLNASARDSDRLLITMVWAQESNAVSTSAFLEEFEMGELSFPDTITRARRQLQAEHEHLRGTTWRERHEDHTQQMQIELGYEVGNNPRG